MAPNIAPSGINFANRALCTDAAQQELRPPGPRSKRCSDQRERPTPHRAEARTKRLCRPPLLRVAGAGMAGLVGLVDDVGSCVQTGEPAVFGVGHGVDADPAGKDERVARHLW